MLSQWIVFYVFFHFSWSGVLAETINMAACKPQKCGNFSISYPFWINGQQPDYCGYPTLMIDCDNGKPLLAKSYNKHYYIKKIFYPNNSAVLVNSELANDDCPIHKLNVSLSLSQFVISPSPLNNELIFFYNCLKPLLPPSDYLNISSCTNRSHLFNESFVRLYANFPTETQDVPDDLPSGCSISKVPVLGSNNRTVEDYANLMKEGFLVSWMVADCSLCQESKGQCGFNSSVSELMCICSNGIGDNGTVYPISCPISGKKRHNPSKIMIAGVAAGGLVALFLLSCICILYVKRRKWKWVSSSSKLLINRDSSDLCMNDLELAGSQYTQIFSYEELEEATDRFISSNELGDGGFGTVYKGKLRDGRIVAVKRLYKNCYKRVEQFMNEVEILSHLRHPNLVTLYGCTACTSHELLLVYEYIPNGTVADHLHGPRVGDQSLTWPIRLNIAIETAHALAFLHSIEPQIIHRDVKTTNILLDEGFHVKVGDFGLSRLFPLDVTHVSTVPQGTPGYVDPVYHQCYQLTEKSDVYSFGVVLIELISSKPAVDMNRSSNEINLANLALNKIQRSELAELVDPAFGYEKDLEMRRMVSLIAELAFRCLQAERDMRPSIKEVLEVLLVVQKEGFGNNNNNNNNSDNNNNGEKVEIKSGIIKEESETCLLRKETVYSPDTVIKRWSSRSTSPNTSV